MALSFRLTSYNVLAGAYATRRLYPEVAPELLEWSRRAPAIVARVVGLAPDVACLQEVEASAWPGLEAAFARHGWQGVFAAKGRGRPDGCALLFRDGALRFVGSEALHFDDGENGAEASGHLALIGTFMSDAGVLRVAGTHLRWQAATAQSEAHIGYRQALQLVEHCEVMRPPAFATVVSGDFNAPPDSAVAHLFAQRGLADAYAAAPQPTCSPNRRATRIDYIVATGALVATPQVLPEIDDATMLPSASEPSDHLPITATLAGAARL